MVYSKKSPACQKLFGYIESLPFDLMNTTGITPCCADNKTMRDTLAKVGVDSVPTLMTKYFNNAQQQVQGDNIYDWIAEIANIMGYAGENNDTPADADKLGEPDVEDDVKGSLLTQALSMQKSRESELTKQAPPVPPMPPRDDDKFSIL